jgi:hypothetical protein
MSLSQAALDPERKTAIVADCVKLVDDEVTSKSGFSGISLKAGYAAVKGIKNGFITEAVEIMLPDFIDKLDPILDEARKKGDVSGYLINNKSMVADLLLSVTDVDAKKAKSHVVRGTYEKLRGSAKKNSKTLSHGFRDSWKNMPVDRTFGRRNGP